MRYFAFCARVLEHMGLAEIVRRAVVSSAIAVSFFALPQPAPAEASPRASPGTSITEARCLDPSSRKPAYSVKSAAVEVFKLFNSKLIPYTAFKLPDEVYCQQAFGATDGNVVTAVNARGNSSGSVLVSTVEGDELIIAKHDGGPIRESVMLRNLKVWGIDSQPSDYFGVIAERGKQLELAIFRITGEDLTIVAVNRILDRPVSGVEVSNLDYSQLRGGDAVLSLVIKIPMEGENGPYKAMQAVSVGIRDIMGSPGTPLFSFIPNKPLGAQSSPLSYVPSDVQHTRLSGWVIDKVASRRGLEEAVASAR